jgi:futalosine hydrolase
VESSICDVLREVTRDRPVILLTATEAEAEPLRAALLKPEKHIVAAKAVYVGELVLDRPGAPPSAPAVGSTPSGGSPPTDGAPPAVRVVLAIGGCDKANTAHILTCLLQAMTPASALPSAPLLVLQVGIAGALPATAPQPGAAIGDIVLATRETYSDTGSSSPEGWLSAAELGLPIACVNGAELGGTFPLRAGLVSAAARVVEALDWSDAVRPKPPPAVLLGPCVTASQVTGVRDEAEAVARRWGALAESMEGAAAAHICALYAVPFLEIRGVSNLVTDRDRSSWQVERAIAVAARAALAVVARLDRLPVGGEQGAGHDGAGTQDGRD